MLLLHQVPTACGAMHCSYADGGTVAATSCQMARLLCNPCRQAGQQRGNGISRRRLLLLHLMLLQLSVTFHKQLRSCPLPPRHPTNSSPRTQIPKGSSQAWTLAISSMQPAWECKACPAAAMDHQIPTCNLAAWGCTACQVAHRGSLHQRSSKRPGACLHKPQDIHSTLSQEWGASVSHHLVSPHSDHSYVLMLALDWC